MRQLVFKNLQAKKLSRAEIDMAVRAVEGIPNAMDMDFSGIDPDLTSLDVVMEGNDFVTGSRRSNHQHLLDRCIVCCQPLADD